MRWDVCRMLCMYVVCLYVYILCICECKHRFVCMYIFLFLCTSMCVCMLVGKKVMYVWMYACIVCMYVSL